MLKIKRISCDDWEGYYINGKLVTENHSIDPRDLLEKIPNIIFESEYCKGDLQKFGYCLPENLEEVENYIKEIVNGTSRTK